VSGNRTHSLSIRELPIAGAGTIIIVHSLTQDAYNRREWIAPVS